MARTYLDALNTAIIDSPRKKATINKQTKPNLNQKLEGAFYNSVVINECTWQTNLPLYHKLLKKYFKEPLEADKSSTDRDNCSKCQLSMDLTVKTRVQNLSMGLLESKINIIHTHKSILKRNAHKIFFSFRYIILFEWIHLYWLNQQTNLGFYMDALSTHPTYNNQNIEGLWQLSRQWKKAGSQLQCSSNLLYSKIAMMCLQKVDALKLSSHFLEPFTDC